MPTKNCGKCGKPFTYESRGDLFYAPPELCPSCEEKMKKEATEFWKNNPHADNDLRMGGSSIRNVSKVDFRPLSSGQASTNLDPKTQLVFPTPSETKLLTKSQIDQLSEFASGAAFLLAGIKAYSDDAAAAVNRFTKSVNAADKAVGVAGAVFSAKEVIDLALKDGYDDRTAAMWGVSIGAAGLIPVVSIYDTVAYGVNKGVYGSAVGYNTIIKHVADLAHVPFSSRLMTDPNLAVQQHGARSSAQLMYQAMHNMEVYFR